MVCQWLSKPHRPRPGILLPLPVDEGSFNYPRVLDNVEKDKKANRVLFGFVANALIWCIIADVKDAPPWLSWKSLSGKIVRLFGFR